MALHFCPSAMLYYWVVITREVITGICYILYTITLPVRIKDHAKASTVVRKSNIRTYTPPEKVKVEPNIAIVKDLLSDNIDGNVI